MVSSDAFMSRLVSLATCLAEQMSNVEATPICSARVRFLSGSPTPIDRSCFTVLYFPFHRIGNSSVTKNRRNSSDPRRGTLRFPDEQYVSLQYA